jgi:hypothetical protein
MGLQSRALVGICDAAAPPPTVHARRMERGPPVSARSPSFMTGAFIRMATRLPAASSHWGEANGGIP